MGPPWSFMPGTARSVTQCLASPGPEKAWQRRRPTTWRRHSQGGHDQTRPDGMVVVGDEGKCAEPLARPLQSSLISQLSQAHASASSRRGGRPPSPDSLCFHSFQRPGRNIFVALSLAITLWQETRLSPSTLLSLIHSLRSTGSLFGFYCLFLSQPCGFERLWKQVPQRPTETPNYTHTYLRIQF